MAEIMAKIGGHPNIGIASLSDCQEKFPNSGEYRINTGAKNHWILNSYDIFGDDWSTNCDSASKVFAYTYGSYGQTYYKERIAAPIFGGTFLDGPYAAGITESDYADPGWASYPDGPWPRGNSGNFLSRQQVYDSTISASGPGSISSKISNSGMSGSDRYGYNTSKGPQYQTINISFNHDAKEVSERRYNDSSLKHIGGENLKYTASPNDNCRVKEWRDGGSIIGGRNQNSIDYRLPSRDVNIVCVFEQYKYPVSVKHEGNGKVTGGPEQQSVYMEVGKQSPEYIAIVDDAANYRFAGWFAGYGDNLEPSACNILVTTDPKFRFTVEAQPVTYCAKFTLRKTRIAIEANGTGVFTADVNDKRVATKQTYYENVDARDGWKVRLLAEVTDPHFFFHHWDVPDGITTSKNVNIPEYTTQLQPRESNAFTAYFKEKTTAPITVSITGRGQATYSGELSAGGTVLPGTPTVISDTYVQTAYVFKATDTDRLYTFDKWQVKVGEEFVDVSSAALPTWIQQVDGDKIVVFVKEGDVSKLELRAVFRELTTYKVAAPTIEGSHPIFKDRKAKDGNCTVVGMPSADKGGDMFIEGTKITLTLSPGPKWVAKEITVTKAGSPHTYEGNKATFIVDDEIVSIQAVFTAKTYLVSASADPASAKIGLARFTYIKFDGQPETTSKETEVYVDTSVDVEGYLAEGVDAERASFSEWMINGKESIHPATASFVVGGDMRFVAKFAADIDVRIEGVYKENEKEYALGSATVAVKQNGAEGIPEPAPVTKRLVCGEVFDILAKAEKGQTETGKAYEGFFNGWFESTGPNWNQIEGWGEAVDGIVVEEPRSIKAKFSEENRWPILRLRNPAGVEFCSFEVSGVRKERVQHLVSGDVALTNPLDFFCDPYSMVQIRVVPYSGTSRFLHWNEVDFGTITTPGTEVVKQYGTVRDFTVFMTKNLHLQPIFWTGKPVLIVAGYVGDEAAGSVAGAVAVEGDPVDRTSDSSASFVQNDKATLVASPNNGFLFVGWYANASGTGEPVSTEPRFDVTADVDKAYYAKFDEDPNAIYTWATSKVATKLMTWRSKRITTASPVSFSSARIDAEGYGPYGVNLTTYKSSSPDVPYKSNDYVIMNSNSRRLAMGSRGEKIFEFEVKSTTPINFVGISTSVMGLIGGQS